MFQLVPSGDVGGLVVVTQGAKPRANGDVCDGVISGNPVFALQGLVQHLQQPLCLGAVAFFGARIGNVFAREMVEVAKLPEHWPDAAHLEHHPLKDFPTGGHGQQLAGLFRQTDQDRAAFEQGQRLAARTVGIKDSGDLVVGVEAEEFGAGLVVRLEADQMCVAGQAHLFQRDGNLGAVRGGQGVELDGLRVARRPFGGDRIVAEKGQAALLAL